MARAKITTDIYIDRAKSIHGDRYDYSKVDYVNMHTHVTIVCKVHGEFIQNPQLHLKGSGCPICGQEKYKQTLIEKYGVDNPMKLKSIAQKMSTTVKSKSEDEKDASLKKRKSTNLKRYGFESASQNPEIIAKIQKSIFENNDIDEIKAKIEKTCLERYGSKTFLSSDYAREKIKETNIEKYNGPAPMCSDEIKQKTSETVKERYGVESIMMVDEVVQKIHQSKVANNTYGVSSVEENMYFRLCDLFGSDDVERQYKSKVYPFSCDFYIKSRDMYIEFNGLWTHGKKWFNENEPRFTKIVELWKSKNTKYYDNAVDVWTIKDVNKRKVAKQNNLNYLVFWLNDLKDFDLWVACGCPDGRDYISEYSWLPSKDVLKSNTVTEFTGSIRNLHAYTKRYQFNEFYKHELELWKDRTVQMKLYLNRWKYTNKLPYELSDSEILQGFKISGIHRGYSVFDNKAMLIVLDKYNIKSVFDPCAGWGERMLTCYSKGIDYLGLDINDGLRNGYSNLKTVLNLVNQEVIIKDSSEYVPHETFDAVITCPPYGNLEIYSDKGAENLSDENFILWWEKVVRNIFNSNIQYFCFQINQKWKTRLSDVVEELGFTFLEEIELKKQVSHFNRNNRNKNEYESMLVFTK